MAKEQVIAGGSDEKVLGSLLKRSISSICADPRSSI